LNLQTAPNKIMPNNRDRRYFEQAKSIITHFYPRAKVDKYTYGGEKCGLVVLKKMKGDKWMEVTIDIKLCLVLCYRIEGQTVKHSYDVETEGAHVGRPLWCAGYVPTL
jgi:hypothetical protein